VVSAAAVPSPSLSSRSAVAVVVSVVAVVSEAVVSDVVVGDVDEHPTRSRASSPESRRRGSGIDTGE
jgi:hypothetical protein